MKFIIFLVTTALNISLAMASTADFHKAADEANRSKTDKSKLCEDSENNFKNLWSTEVKDGQHLLKDLAGFNNALDLESNLGEQVAYNKEAVDGFFQIKKPSKQDVYDYMNLVRGRPCTALQMNIWSTLIYSSAGIKDDSALKNLKKLLRQWVLEDIKKENTQLSAMIDVTVTKRLFETPLVKVNDQDFLALKDILKDGKESSTALNKKFDSLIKGPATNINDTSKPLTDLEVQSQTKFDPVKVQGALKSENVESLKIKSRLQNWIDKNWRE